MKTIPAFYFDRESLEQLAEEHRKTFAEAAPFRHIVIDAFLPEEIAAVLESEFPGPEGINWTFWGPGDTKHSGNRNVEKVGNSDETRFPPFTRHFMSQLNSGVFLQFVEKLTGTAGLVPDPSFNACGQHSTGPGGRLMIHTDDNRHPIKNRFHQHYNLIYFLNRDWKEEYGGHLELWSRDARTCVKKVAPLFNRAVLFDTGKYSFHGHPEPLTCPPDRRRNSLAVYYYVTDRPDDETYRGFQSISWVPTTETDQRYSQSKAFLAKKVLRQILPPVTADLFRWAKKQIGR